MKEVNPPKIDNIFYKKVGKRYVPVRADLEWTGFPAGLYITLVQKGMKSTCRVVDQKEIDDATLVIRGVLRMMGEDLTRFVSDIVHARPQKQPLKPETIKAWEEFRRIAGEELSLLQYESCAGIVDKFMAIVEDKVKETRTIDSDWL